jgi:hypothetical protein
VFLLSINSEFLDFHEAIGLPPIFPGLGQVLRETLQTLGGPKVESKAVLDLAMACAEQALLIRTEMVDLEERVRDLTAGAKNANENLLRKFYDSLSGSQKSHTEFRDSLG